MECLINSYGIMSELLSPQEEDCANEEWPFTFQMNTERKESKAAPAGLLLSSAHDVAMSLLHPPSLLTLKDCCIFHDNMFVFQL